eukprot:gene9757-10599_t
MGNCLVIQVSATQSLPDNKKRKEKKISILKNNVVAPTSTKKLEEEEHSNVESNLEEENDDAEGEDNDYSSAPPPTTEIVVNKRRFSTISNLTMDEALLVLEKQLQGGPSRRVSLLLVDSPTNHDMVKEDDEIKLMQEMILSYLQVMNEDNSKFNSLLLQLYHLEAEAREAKSQPVTPRVAHRRQRRRSSVLGCIKEEFRQAISTRADAASVETQIKDF